MLTDEVPSIYRTYDDAMWSTSITGMIEPGNDKQYCTQHDIPYTIFKRYKYNAR